MKRWLLLAIVVLLMISSGCTTENDQPYDTNTQVSVGEPAFPPLDTKWVIDQAGVLNPSTVEKAHLICQKLQDDGIAEMVILTMRGVKNPEDYAMKYGRWLKLGKKGYSGEGGNNGIVWLIRPDKDSSKGESCMTIQIGRGLPQFTTIDQGEIFSKIKDYINFGNYDKGVIVLATETDQFLRVHNKKR